MSFFDEDSWELVLMSSVAEFTFVVGSVIAAGDEMRLFVRCPRLAGPGFIVWASVSRSVDPSLAASVFSLLIAS